mmetsp:Transcript_5134/g.6981  ORF Transcript_5134/g.6981 Transcript_5134/m.6981 type:complete len:456 (+) Transcript_5134:188-1555(+)|eukprot:CAMPEP_0116062002 /NCGR_PEP_ID=MMETSP0322-20121206/7442_1 /TAXON_ID=163516 /ORGANISM="Leptocylindrus danicus var. apora, Strain B651" /LENGTH=455 /DNA_ID=CAMNT_0003547111 /DNA_START=103 /DNA_END=1470 /DNA_ORIENTATION=+
MNLTDRIILRGCFILATHIAVNGFIPYSMQGNFRWDSSTTTRLHSAEGGVQKPKYDLGIGKHLPVNVQKGEKKQDSEDRDDKSSDIYNVKKWDRYLRVNNDDENSESLANALWDKDHYDVEGDALECEDGDCFDEKDAPIAFATIHDDELPVRKSNSRHTGVIQQSLSGANGTSINENSYSGDKVWDMMRYEARREAEREPLLVSFLFSSILNHDSLESALAFHLANRLASPSMISTQIMSLCLEAFDNSHETRESMRADIMAVRERDPACTCLPDVFLYFKGFHALQTHRVSNYLWKNGRRVLAHYLQSQMSQVYQIDIHPNASLGRGIMLDHGTGIVIGETAVVGDDCSILHHVTLGGSGKKNVDRHPKVGKGVLIGAGASVLGNVRIGDGVQIGAGTLVINDLPDHSVAVGVPAKIIGEFKAADDSVTPASNMNQLGTNEGNDYITFHSESI